MGSASATANASGVSPSTTPAVQPSSGAGGGGSTGARRRRLFLEKERLLREAEQATPDLAAVHGEGEAVLAGILASGSGSHGVQGFGQGGFRTIRASGTADHFDRVSADNAIILMAA